MTKLLVSVRTPEEALVAVENGADIVDAKEPSLGSLGQVPEAARASICQVVTAANAARSTATQVSIALGELKDFDVTSMRSQDWTGVTYAKIGCAGCSAKKIQEDWPVWAASLPSPMRSVAVVYADCQTPLLGHGKIIELAQQANSAGLLLDTRLKGGRRLLDFFDVPSLVQLRLATRRAGLMLALAGSLRLEDMDVALAVDPDVIAVRGAACEDGRLGRVAARRVREIKQRIEAAPHSSFT